MSLCVIIIVPSSSIGNKSDKSPLCGNKLKLVKGKHSEVKIEVCYERLNFFLSLQIRNSGDNYVEATCCLSIKIDYINS
jgi:hypothetical protein